MMLNIESVSFFKEGSDYGVLVSVRNPGNASKKVKKLKIRKVGGGPPINLNNVDYSIPSKNARALGVTGGPNWHSAWGQAHKKNNNVSNVSFEPSIPYEIEIEDDDGNVMTQAFYTPKL